MHASVEQLLSLRDDNLVDAVVSQHVDQCGLCQKELEALRSIKQSLNDLPLEQPPAHLFSNIL
ncbi:MAG: hypothetical protein AAF438_12065, partial [Pseudomonadota bacterium]